MTAGWPEPPAATTATEAGAAVLIITGAPDSCLLRLIEADEVAETAGAAGIPNGACRCDCGGSWCWNI